MKNQDKKMSVTQIVDQLKASNEDFEWYPTTREIIEAMYWDIRGEEREDESVYRCERKHVSILDIGAGNCKLFSTIRAIADEQPDLDDYYYHAGGSKSIRDGYEKRPNQVHISKYMAIEKSQTLIDAMPNDVFVVGTDFNENTLIDKRADIVFCNPPYSQYAQWTERIIKEANADYVYLVIPQRWGKNKSVLQALKARKATVKLVGSFDFLNSEDRKARAKVSLLKVELAVKYSKYHDAQAHVDPFDLWFNETFSVEADKASDGYETDYTKRQGQKASHKEKVRNALVSGRDLVTILVELYNHELEHLIGNYKKVTELDPDILKELGVKVGALKDGLKQKISGLKVLYWEEIFENLEQITSRLTSRSRDSMLKTLMANTSIDFTATNVYSVVIWAIKNANQYFDQQMIEVYDQFISEEGLKFYKSNQHFLKDTFRYCRSDLDKKGIKYALDYRIVLHDYPEYWESRDNVLSVKQITRINDLIIVAKNLGFSIDGFMNKVRLGEKDFVYFKVPGDRKLTKGTKTHLGRIDEVYEQTEDNGKKWMQYLIDGQYYHGSIVRIEDDIFTTVKGFKNGNVHYQLNQKFIKKLNLEVGRLRGWIKSPAEAAEEFDITAEEANEYWNSNYQMLPSHVGNLLPASPAAEPEIEIESEPVVSFDSAVVCEEIPFEVETEADAVPVLDEELVDIVEIDAVTEPEQNKSEEDAKLGGLFAA
ncbi:DUF4942 domain-containing protein [Sulfuricurvum sp. IAE1]|uniref:DUF4942 domain-containing protein n=1 Tax=Sulfuricurvum sp. IAE1 TaxID=2546102 RepID=UPI00104B93EA|nr:DUF4942 domain-containing protein [Sulfuricurvum sp. IAE1]TDA63607.1 DUF4942 domain-containing protein [Sulfuricurvum sp. IAE1]